MSLVFVLSLAAAAVTASALRSDKETMGSFNSSVRPIATSPAASPAAGAIAVAEPTPASHREPVAGSPPVRTASHPRQSPTIYLTDTATDVTIHVGTKVVLTLGPGYHEWQEPQSSDPAVFKRISNRLKPDRSDTATFVGERVGNATVTVGVSSIEDPCIPLQPCLGPASWGHELAITVIR